MRFEEEALELSDQVYRVARRLVSTREEAEDLVQETYARAFRSWRSYTPGTNLRAWLLRILTNLNIDSSIKSLAQFHKTLECRADALTGGQGVLFLNGGWRGLQSPRE